jgi:translocation and assembly module TamB
MGGRRLLRLAVVTVGSLAAGLVLLLFGALLLVNTRWGNRLVLARALPLVDGLVAGGLTIENIHLGVRRLSLAGIALRDPEGNRVAEVDQLEVTFSPRSLLRRRVELTAVTLQRPRLWLVRDERGFNLARALAGGAHPAPATAPRQAPGRLMLAVQRLELRAGEVELRTLQPPNARSGSLPIIRVTELAAAGDALYEVGTGRLRVALELAGKSWPPLAGPIDLSLEGELDQARVQVRVALGLGPNRLQGELRSEARGESEGHHQTFTLRQLRLTPDLVRALIPSWPVLGAIEARGLARRRGSALDVDLAFQSAGGEISVVGRLDTGTWHSPGFHIRGQAIDLGALFARAPRSDLAFSLDGWGGRTQRDVDGEVTLHIPPGQIGASAAGPLHLRLRAERSEYRLEELFAAIPGVSFSASGQASRQWLAARARLEIENPPEATRALIPGAIPPIAGRGQLRARVEGSWQTPALTVSGWFPRIRFREHEGRAVALQVRVPNLRQSQLISGSLAIGSARIGSRRLQQIALTVRTEGDRSFTASLGTQRPQPLSLSAGGRWWQALDGLTLRSLTIAYPEAAWRMLRPTRIAAGAALSVEDLRLVSGDQRLELSLSHTERHLRAHAAVASIDLALLPRIARTALPQVAGRLDATIDVAGSLDRPTLRAQGSVTRGHLARLGSIDLLFGARAGRGRVSGQLRAQALGAQINTRFDLPRSFPPPPGAAIDLSLETTPVRLDRVAVALGLGERGINGRASLRAQVGGTGSAPTVDVAADVQNMVVRGRPVGAIHLAVAASPGAPLSADLRLEALGRTGTATLRMPYDLARAWLRAPSPRELLEMPFEVTAQVENLPLEALAALRNRTAALSGSASLRLEARGTGRSPVGSLRLQLQEITAPGIPPTDARLEVEAVDAAVGLTAALLVSRMNQTLATAQASLALPTTELGNRLARAQAPLRLDGRLGPIELQRLVAPPENDRQAARRLDGRVQATVHLEGSLGSPRLTVRALADDVTLQDAPLGQASLVLSYADQRPRLDLQLDGAEGDGGRVQLAAESQADLGHLVRMGGASLRRLPVKAHLEAVGYDLKPLSCISDRVRMVEGRLGARLEVHGPLGAPRVRGRLEWKDGRLGIAGLGDYRDIHLLMHGDDTRMVLEKLTARSGGGSARLTASAERRDGGKVLLLSARGQIRRFPIRVDGQRIASLSMDPRLSGRASLDHLDLRAELGKVDVRLAPGTRREVQPLHRLEDVVLYLGDQPLNRAQGKKHTDLAQARWQLLTGHAPPDSGSSGRPRGHSLAGRVPRVSLEMSAPKNIWIRGPDINVELGLGPTFMLLAHPEPSIFGTVLVRRGQIEVLGRRFRLEDSSVLRFTGPPDRPILDLQAVHQPRHADFTVVLTLKGPPDALETEVASPEHPEYAQADLLTAIATGRPPEEPAAISPSVDERAASLLGGLLADKVRNTLMRRLPIDVLNIDPGEGLRAVQLEAGTYLGDDLYVAYVGRFGGDPFLRENQNEVQLEYRLSQRWSFQAIYGDARRGTADLVWTKRY